MDIIIFDLDGTLIDSMGMWRNLIINFMKENDINASNEILQHLNTLSIKMSIEYLKDNYKFKKSKEEIYEEFHNKILNFYLNEVEEKEEAFNTLKKYKELGHKLVLGTATNFIFVEPLLNRFNLNSMFDLIQTSDLVNFPKNNIRFFEIISEKMNPKNDIILFDDSIHALATAKSVGITTVGVYDFNSKTFWDEIKINNDYHIESFKDWVVK